MRPPWRCVFVEGGACKTRSRAARCGALELRTELKNFCSGESLARPGLPGPTSRLQKFGRHEITKLIPKLAKRWAPLRCAARLFCASEASHICPVFAAPASLAAGVCKVGRACQYFRATRRSPRSTTPRTLQQIWRAGSRAPLSAVSCPNHQTRLPAAQHTEAAIERRRPTARSAATFLSRTPALRASAPLRSFCRSPVSPILRRRCDCVQMRRVTLSPSRPSCPARAPTTCATCKS